MAYDDRSRKIARERYWDEHDRRMYECPDCGRSQDEVVGEFQVHHKNQNPYDNRLDQLVGLCGFCHRLREGKKPSLDRIKQFRNSSLSIDEDCYHPYIQQFIDERLCLHSEGRDYSWLDPLSLHFDVLDKFLQKYGYAINDKFKTEYTAALRSLPETNIDWTISENGAVAVIGPDPHGRRNCDCLTSADLDVGHDGPGDWR